MAEESLKARVREKLLRQIAEDGGEQTEDDDDPRLIALEGDLVALDEAERRRPRRRGTRRAVLGAVTDRRTPGRAKRRGIEWASEATGTKSAA